MNPNDLLKTRRQRREEEVRFMCRKAWHNNMDLVTEGKKLEVQDQIYWKKEMDVINADPFTQILRGMGHA